MPGCDGLKERENRIFQHRRISSEISPWRTCAARPAYFSTLFKKETGEGFSKRLTQVRIDWTKELPLETGLPVAEVSRRWDTVTASILPGPSTR